MSVVVGVGALNCDHDPCQVARRLPRGVGGASQAREKKGFPPHEFLCVSAPGVEWGLDVVETPGYRISGHIPIREYLALGDRFFGLFINLALVLCVCIHIPVCIL